MRHQRFLLAFLSGFLAWSFSNLAWGGRGALAYEKLKTIQSELTSVIEQLNVEKNQQETDFQALLREPERLKLTARKLGYFEADEYLLFSEYTTPERLRKNYRLNSLPIRQKEEDSNPLPLFFGVIFFILTLFLVDVWANARKPRFNQVSIKENLNGVQIE